MPERQQDDRPGVPEPPGEETHTADAAGQRPWTLPLRPWPVGPLRRRDLPLRPQFDRLLVLAALLAFASLYLPWLPGIYNAVPGWKVPYAALDVPLDEIRHLENVNRPESLFLMILVGMLALVFCRTSRYVGVRDLTAGVILVTGGGYLLIYFAGEWGWCLTYSYVGPYLAFGSVGLLVMSGLLRSRFMPWIPKSRILLLMASAFLITGWFMPWALEETGVTLFWASREFHWLGSLKIFASLVAIFPVLGVVGFVAAFSELPAIPPFAQRSWPLCFGLAALVYFRAFWARYLTGFPLGSWGTLVGLTILTTAGVFHLFPRKPFLARLLLYLFLIVNTLAWFSFLAPGRLEQFVRDLFNVPPVFRV